MLLAATAGSAVPALILPVLMMVAGAVVAGPYGALLARRRDLAPALAAVFA